jgi:hypothetical protein
VGCELGLHELTNHPAKPFVVLGEQRWSTEELHP